MSKEIHDLLLDVQKKDRRYRFFQSTFTLLILSLLLVVVVAQFQTLNTVKGQLAEQKRINELVTERSESERREIIRRLNCMVAFFTVPDRSNLTIYDVDRCALNYTAEPREFFIAPSVKESEPAPAPKPETTQPKQEETKPAQQPTPPAAAPPQPEQPMIESFFDNPLNAIRKLIGG